MLTYTKSIQMDHMNSNMRNTTSGNVYKINFNLKLIQGSMKIVWKNAFRDLSIL